MQDVGDDLFALGVVRVGLAGEDQLHRPVPVVEDGPEPLGVAKDERPPLVGGKPAGEADRQRAGVELRRSARARDELEQAHLRRAMCIPELRRGNSECAIEVGRAGPEHPFELA